MEVQEDHRGREHTLLNGIPLFGCCVVVGKGYGFVHPYLVAAGLAKLWWR